MNNKNYLYAGGVIIIVLASILLFVEPKDKFPERGPLSGTLTPEKGFSHGHGIAVDVAEANKLYIATHQGLFVLFDDKDLFRIGKTRDDLMGFSVHPTNPMTFFSSGHSARGGNLGFQRSDDGGVSWKMVSAGISGPVDFHSLAVSLVNPNIVYGSFRGDTQRSIDGGGNWELAKGKIAPISLTPDPFSEKTLYAGTQDGALVSMDSGDSWKSISTAVDGEFVTMYAPHPVDNNFVLAFSQKQGGLAKSTDKGVSWTKVSEQFGGAAVLYIAYAKQKPDTIYALTNENTLYKSEDKGESFMKIR